MSQNLTVVDADEKSLSVKHMAFVDAYMIDRNATKAAIAAGYSVKRAAATGCELLTNRKISEEIVRRVEEYSRTAGITVVALLEEAKKIAFSRVTRVFSPETGAMMPVHLIDDDTADAIASIKVTETSQGPDAEPIYTKEVRMLDKGAAIFKLLEFMRPMSDQPKNEVTVNVNVQNLMAVLTNAAPLPA